MNHLQLNTLRHLSQPGHPERIQALDDLMNQGAFSARHDTSETEKRLQEYLRQNPRGFCAEGIQRFRTATGLPASVGRTVTVTMQITLPEFNHWQPTGGPAFTIGSGVAQGIQRALMKEEVYPGIRFKNAEVVRTEGI